MNKVLFIGPYRQSDEWGTVSKDYIRSLLTIENIDLVIRPIYLSTLIDNNIENDFLELESKHKDKYDAIIQHSLPSFFMRSRHCKKNIGIFQTEIFDLEYTSWTYKCGLMDQIWVPTSVERDSLEGRIGTATAHSIGLPIYFDKNIEDEDPDIGSKPVNAYFIGEDGPRQNIDMLIKAYYMATSPNSELGLTLVVQSSNHKKTRQNILDRIEKIKFGLRKYQKPEAYPKITLITGELTRRQLNKIHELHDFIVMPSYGESIYRPVIEAMYFGNPAIVTDNTGMSDYINEDNGWLIEGSRIPIFTRNPPINTIYTCRESWVEPCLASLMDCLLEAKDTFLHKTTSARQSYYEAFSFEDTGNKMKDLLNA